jgi:hypothetical protein
MAIDIEKPGDAKPSPLRTAMDRAGGAVQKLMREASAAPVEGDVLELTDVVEKTQEPGRRMLRRVDIKVQLLSYIDSQFRQRTTSDGTILAVSREKLVEELTDLMVELDERVTAAYMQG